MDTGDAIRFRHRGPTLAAESHASRFPLSASPDAEASGHPMIVLPDGRSRVRTDDHRCVKPALYQLSYPPEAGRDSTFVGDGDGDGVD